MSNINRYEIIVLILCKNYNKNYDEFKNILNEKENLYIMLLLMKKFRCLNGDIIQENLGILNSRMLNYKIKKAEEKILINKNFREEYFELEDKIKQNLKSI